MSVLEDLPGIIEGLPLADIEAAINDPTNLGKEAAVVKDIIAVAMPTLPGTIVNLLITLFVAAVYASGGGIISPDYNPQADAQTKTQGGRPT